MKLSIRVKLAGAVLVPLVIVFTAVLVIDYSLAHQQAIEQAAQHLAHMTANHAARLDGRFGGIEQAAIAVGEQISESDPPLAPRIALVRVMATAYRNNAVRWAALVMEPAAETAGAAGAAPFARYLQRSQRPPNPRDAAGGRPATRPARRPRRPLAEVLPRRPVPWYQRRPQQRAGGQATPQARPRPFLKQGDLAREQPDFRTQDWYRKARATREVVWSEPMRTAEGEPLVARCSVPLIRGETVFGVVAFDVALEPVRKYVRDSTPPSGYSILLSSEGRLVCHPGAGDGPLDTLEELAVEHACPPLHDLSAQVRQGRSGIVHFADFHTGKQSWAVFQPLATTGWSFGAVVPEASITRPVEQRLGRDMLLLLAGLGLAVLITLGVSLRITRPIVKLAPVVRQVAEGNLDVQAEDVGNGDEIGEFARAFNKMIVDLKGHVADLTRETAARQAFESELNVARDIQKSLLPSGFPDADGFALHAVNVPANHVAGDFFDFFFVDDDTLALLIADVVGKGAAAALFMAVTRTVIRNQAFDGASPAEVLTAANRVIAADNERGMFVTLFFAHYDTKTGRLAYANAGHCPPVIGTRDGDLRTLNGKTNPILGVFEDQPYHQHEAQLHPADSLVLYTDGVTEAMNADDAMFSETHLKQLVSENPAASPEELCELIVESVEGFRTHPRQDDVTVLVLRRNR